MPSTKSIDTNGLLYFASLVKTALAGKVDASTYNTKQAEQDALISGLQSALSGGVQTILATNMSTASPGVYYVSDMPALMIVGTDDTDHPTLWLTKDNILYCQGSPSYANAAPFISIDITRNPQDGVEIALNLGSNTTWDTIPVAAGASGQDEAEAGLMSAADKTKLDGVATGAQVNVIENIRLSTSNTTPLSVDEKTVTIPVASSAIVNNGSPVSSGAVYNIQQSLNGAINSRAPLASPDLTGTPTAPTAASGTNTTQIATTAFVQAAIAAAVAGRFKFVSTLPSTGETGYIYLVPHTHTSGTTNTNPDLKDEYVWNADAMSWELIGNTDINLSTHWSKTELEVATNTEVLAAWTNASVISA